MTPTPPTASDTPPPGPPGADTRAPAEPDVRPFDVEAIRRDFPALCQEINGHPLAYLDTSATSLKPECVIETIADHYRHDSANVHRGVHTLSQRATEAYENARERIARAVGAPAPSNIVFTRNTTESINLVAHAWGRKTGGFGRRYVDSGDEILLTEMEHHSNLVPWQILAEETGATLRFVPILEDGTLDLDEMLRLLGSRTRVVAVTHVSNVLGAINPVARICRLVRERSDAVTVIDGAQAVPHIPVDLREIGPDFYAFSAHKMLGPTGIGCLYGTKERLLDMNPFLGGGDMIRTVWYDKSLWNELPYKFEAGTPAIAEAIGMGAAFDYLTGFGLDRVAAHSRDITDYALDRLDEIPGLHVYGPRPDRAPLVSFALDGAHPHDVATILDQHGIAIRAGHHCAQPLLRKLGVITTSRASFYLYTTRDEIDRLCTSLVRIAEMFQA